MLTRITKKSAYNRQVRNLVLGKIEKVPMPKEVAALRMALYRRDQQLNKKAEDYEATCPPFDAENMLKGLELLRVPTKAQEEDIAMLRGLLEAQPKTVSYAVTFSKDTYKVGLRALRKVGDIDSEMSWVVGHYLTSTITWYHFVGQGLYVIVRKRFIFLTCVLLLATAVGFAAKKKGHEIVDAKRIHEKIETAIVNPVALEKARRQTSRNNVLSYAAPVAIATMIFGYPGTAFVGGASFVGLLISSIVPADG